MFPIILNVIKFDQKPVSFLEYKELSVILKFLPSECHSFYKNILNNSNVEDFSEEN